MFELVIGNVFGNVFVWFLKGWRSASCTMAGLAGGSASRIELPSDDLPSWAAACECGVHTRRDKMRNMMLVPTAEHRCPVTLANLVQILIWKMSVLFSDALTSTQAGEPARTIGDG